MREGKEEGRGWKQGVRQEKTRRREIIHNASERT
jgi:hypothetical protein